MSLIEKKLSHTERGVKRDAGSTLGALNTRKSATQRINHSDACYEQAVRRVKPI